MRVVRTVLGDIAPSELGVTQTHEHLYCDQTLNRSAENFPTDASFMVLRDPNLVVAALDDFRSAGGRAIAVMSVTGLARDVAVLRDISTKAGIHVVATAGFYTEECLPAFVMAASVSELTDFPLKELTEGADGTNIRPGLLKSGVGRPVIEGTEKRCAQAVARAQKITGLAITTHTSGSRRFEIPGGNLGMQHLDLFEEEGVDPSRVIIGHTDENADVRHLVALARRGAYIQFDVIGKHHWLLDSTRVELLARLADLDCGDRLLLSTDRCRETELKVRGGAGYDYLLRDFLPRLHDAGFDPAFIDKMLVQNPAEILAIDGD